MIRKHPYIVNLSPLKKPTNGGGVCSTGAFKGVFLISQVCNGRITPVVSNNNKSIIEPKHVVGTYCWIKFDQRNKFAKPAASNRSFGLGRYLKLMFSLARDVASLNIFPLHVSIILFILGSFATWVFPKIGVPQNGWFMMENPIKMDDLGVTIIFGNTHVYSDSVVSCSFSHASRWISKHSKNSASGFLQPHFVLLFIELLHFPATKNKCHSRSHPDHFRIFENKF